jgi:hypothetical protein
VTKLPPLIPATDDEAQERQADLERRAKDYRQQEQRRAAAERERLETFRRDCLSCSRQYGNPTH